MDTTGNTVRVTGGGSGIGLALTRLLAEAGNQVVVCGRSEEGLERARAVPGVATMRRDLRSPDEIDELLHWLKAEYPRLNVLVNNAGIMRRHDVTAMSPDADVEEEVATNPLAPIRLSLGLLPMLCRQPKAAIVNISSALAWAPMAGAPVYCATKAGLHSFTQSLRTQTTATPIHVMEVLPPTVDTAMTREMETHKITPEAMAHAIMGGLEKGSDEVVIGQARVLRVLSTVMPGVARRVLAKAS